MTNPALHQQAEVLSEPIPEGANEIKHRLRKEHGLTLKDFAHIHGFKYRTVSDVVRGLRKGSFGEGCEVRLARNLPVSDWAHLEKRNMKTRYRLNTDGSISIIALSPEYAAQLRRQRRAYLSPVRTKTTSAMHPEEIKAEMRMKGVTPAMLCDELDVSAPSISQVITGRAKSTRIQTRISQIIGKPISDIWSGKTSLHRDRSQINEGSYCMNFKVRTIRPTNGTRPLMLISGGPFIDIELTPHQAKMLAAALSGTTEAIAEEDVADPSWRPCSFTVHDCLADACPDIYDNPRPRKALMNEEVRA